MSALEALLQGIIQGITEFLPVSSSGHLSVFQYLTGNNNEGSLFFTLMLHLGTLAAVIAAFYEDIWRLIKEVGYSFKDIFAGKFTFKTDNPNRKMLYMLVIATLPMVLLVPIRGFVSKISGDNDIVVEGICFLITAGLLFLACSVKPGKASIRSMKPRSAVAIGISQVLAAFPGVSRSGATISTGMILGFDRQFMMKFSFLMSIPAILGGAVFEIGDAVEQGVDISFGLLFLGMLAAAVFGYISIMVLRWLMKTNRFKVFAWYMLAAGTVVVILGIIGHIAGWGAAVPSSSVISSSQAISSSGTAVSGADMAEGVAEFIRTLSETA